MPGTEPAQRVPTRRLGAWALAALLAGCSDNPDYDPGRAHHRPEGFVNSDGSRVDKSFPDLLRWFWRRHRDGLPNPPSARVDGYRGFPVLRPDPAALRANRGRPTLTWIGHATALLQIGGLNVLTDPLFSERAFPVQWAGPRRRVPLPLQLGDLPRIDLVLVSHNHYDHLDRATIEALARQAGGPPKFWVPLGVDRWMRDLGIGTARGFDWWERGTIGPVEVDFVPAHHWSARTPFDRSRTLWGGWVLRTSGFSAYFAGDTGYSADFAEIGRRYPGLDLALIPVGGYEPRWFMSDQHVDPSEAVRIHRDLGVRRSVGIHWGTFELTDEPLDAPIAALAAALEAQRVAADRFVLIRHGETLYLDTDKEK